MRESRSSHLLRSFSQPTGMRNNNSNINNINSSSVNTESALRISTTAAKITHKARGAQDLFSRVLQRSLSQPASFKPQLQQQQQQQHHQQSDNKQHPATTTEKQHQQSRGPGNAPTATAAAASATSTTHSATTPAGGSGPRPQPGRNPKQTGPTANQPRGPSSYYAGTARGPSSYYAATQLKIPLRANTNDLTLYRFVSERVNCRTCYRYIEHFLQIRTSKLWQL